MTSPKTKATVAAMKDELTRMRDEIRLKAHLGSMELRDQLQILEPKLDSFERRAEQVTGEVGAELQESYTHLAAALTRLRAGLEKTQAK